MKVGQELEMFTLEDVPRVARQLQKRPPRPREAADEAREFGGWTLDKLEVLRLYLTQYRRVAGSGTYIDAFAGEGHFRVRGDPTKRIGSPLIAGRSKAFKFLHFFEQNHHKADALRLAIAQDDEIPGPTRSRCQVHVGDTNSLLPELLESGEVATTKPCFAFLDPDSTQLSWTTLEAVADFKVHAPETKSCKVELWILFNLHQAVQRLWPKRKDTTSLPPHAGTLSDIMGGEEAWLDLWEDGRPSTHLLQRYRDRIETKLGYRYVLPQVIRDPISNRPQYHMIHASDHPAAVSFMRYAKRNSAAGGQERLFG